MIAAFVTAVVFVLSCWMISFLLRTFAYDQTVSLVRRILG